MQPLVVIVGPTAVGKSRAAVMLARRLNGEIVSGDAFQVYQGLDIGTAKLTEEEMDGIPHHLIDLVRPEEGFSVAAYRDLAVKAVEDIHHRGRLPLLVGGTGLYINAVIDDYTFPDLPTDLNLRHQLKEMGQSQGMEFMYRCLLDVDPQSAARIKPGDLRRVIRALEVYHLAGRPMSSFHRLEEPRISRYDLAMIGLNLPREVLYSRINRRVEEMAARGLVDEVKGLLTLGCRPESNSMQALGYKEIIAFLDGQYDISTAVELIKRNTRRYAKRQLTWFKRDSRIKWYNVEIFTSEKDMVEEIYLSVCRTLSLRVE